MPGSFHRVVKSRGKPAIILRKADKSWQLSGYGAGNNGTERSQIGSQWDRIVPAGSRIPALFVPTYRFAVIYLLV